MPLTPEQQQALDELMRHVHQKPAAQPTPAAPQPEVDWLKTWLGVSGGDLKSGLKSLLAQKDGYEQSILDWVDHNPLEAAFEFVGLAAWAFYRVEKDINPKIKTYVDALYYITTCASVGYADIFAVTQVGRAIASLVMLLGPAFASKTLERGSKSVGQ